MTRHGDALAHLLATDPGVATSYRHAPKQVTPGLALALLNAVLKWYEVHEAARPVPDAVSVMARATVEAMGLDLSARGFGFVILHRCGEEFYFLLVSTWRNENELWESVYYKDGDAMTSFAPFPQDETHKPTFCVWELAPVWHEKKAWVRFVASVRNEAAAEAWLADQYSGPA